MSKDIISAPVMPKMARNRSALHDVLAQGAPKRDITVIAVQDHASWNDMLFYLCHSLIHFCENYYTPPNNEVVGGYIGFTPSVCPSVRLSFPPCPLCNIYSSGWIRSILATIDQYHQRVCRTQWPLALTYIFKVIRPWLRKSCLLCSVYSSGWIIFIFSTNDH